MTVMEASYLKVSHLSSLILLVLKVNIQDFAMSAAAKCPVGWFGENCEFQCHCTTTGCNASGECIKPGRCADGFFGPGCQYWNVVYTDVVGNVPPFLNDQNDSTCNKDTTESPITLLFEKQIKLTWLRMITRYDKNHLKFKIIFNKNKICERQIFFLVDKMTVDVICETKVLVSRLTVQGNVVPHICSIYISGGRNVALKQNTSQSSIPIFYSWLYESSKAVDGDLTVEDNTNSMCTSTREESQPYWFLKFSRPQLLDRVRIYTTERGRKSLEKGFTLTTFGLDGQKLDTVRHTEGKPGDPFIAYLNSSYPVTSLKINSLYNTRLILCEVQTFGETLCPDNMFGLSCDKQCNCGVLEQCNTVMGYCMAGCPNGTFGFQCRKLCNSNCSGKVCRSRTGKCVACESGYTGDICNEECPPEFYGWNCTSRCPKGCKMRLCHSSNGSCTECENDFAGPHCMKYIKHDSDDPVSIFKGKSQFMWLAFIFTLVFIELVFSLWSIRRGVPTPTQEETTRE